jgi:hypothetical protein
MTPHSSILMARRKLPAQLPAELVWPFDTSRKDMVNVPTGPTVAHEMTRNLREPFKSTVRAGF